MRPLLEAEYPKSYAECPQKRDAGFRDEKTLENKKDQSSPLQGNVAIPAEECDMFAILPWMV